MNGRGQNKQIMRLYTVGLLTLDTYCVFVSMCVTVHRLALNVS